MLGPSWVALFRQIPPALHDNLVMITATGTEVMIQRIMVLEKEFVVFRGRFSGVQDSGLVMVMPYDQISSLSFNKRMLEPEVRQIFAGAEFLEAAPIGEKVATAPAEGQGTPTEPKAANETVKPQVAATTAAEPKPSEQAAKPSQPSKATLLARLRERLAGQTKN